MRNLRLALYQPEIPQNTGTILRMSACLGVPVDIIEPCGFSFSERRLKRAGMDYVFHSKITRHVDWKSFVKKKSCRRLVAVDLKGCFSLGSFSFSSTDIILMGKESNGLPDELLMEVDYSLHIPMLTGFRSLNLAVSVSMVLGVALYQLNKFP